MADEQTNVLEDEEVEEQIEEQTEDEGENEDQVEPNDLAAAFKILKEVNAESADDNVADGNSEQEEQQPGPEDAQEYLDEGDDLSDGRSPIGYGADDYSTTAKEITQQIDQAAIQLAAQKLQKQGIRPMDISDIYERTQDGRVVYNNPDDKNRPFASRMEAQQWIDSLNKQIANELKKQARTTKQQLDKALRPSMELLAFAPQYDAMNAAEKSFMDDLLEGREIVNNAGKIIGFNANLQKTADKAKKMAAKYAKQTPRKAAKKSSEPQKSPATDLPSHGTTKDKRASQQDPQTLEDAFRILAEQRKEEKK